MSTASKPGPPAKPPRSALSMRDLLGAIVFLVLVVLLLGGLTRGCSFAPAGPTVDPGAGPTVDAPGQLRALARGTPFTLRVPAVPADWRANAVGTVEVGQPGHRAVRTGYVLPSGHYLRVVQSDADGAELVASEAEGAGASQRAPASEERTGPGSRPFDSEAEGAGASQRAPASEERTGPGSRPFDSEAEGAGASQRAPASEERTGPGSRPSNDVARGTPVPSGSVDVAGTSWMTYGGGTPEPIWLAQVDGVRLLITGSGDDAEFRTLAAATTNGDVPPH